MTATEEAKVRNLIEIVSARFRTRARRKGVDIRDLKQAAWEHVIRYFSGWKPEIAALETYFWGGVHGAMGRELRKLSSLTHPNYGDRDRSIDPDETILDNSGLLTTIRSQKILRMLLDATNGDCVVADTYAAYMLDEFVERECCERLGMSRRSWRRLSEGITERIRDGKTSERTWR